LLGALLIGVAVVIGIVLLQVGDNNDNGPTSAAGNQTTTTKQATTTTTSTSDTNPTSSTTPTGTPRPPAEVRLIVLNGGAAAGQAGDMSDTLRTKGYTNQPKLANDWTGHTQTGDSVTCREGFEREGTALAIQVGSGTKTIFPYPTPPPPFSSDVDCVVVVGAAAG
jgi:hypothetical protein